MPVNPHWPSLTCHTVIFFSTPAKHRGCRVKRQHSETGYCVRPFLWGSNQGKRKTEQFLTCVCVWICVNVDLCLRGYLLCSCTCCRLFGIFSLLNYKSCTLFFCVFSDLCCRCLVLSHSLKNWTVCVCVLLQKV